VANGSHKPGPAQADRYREKYRAKGRSLQVRIDSLASAPGTRSYSDSDSEITANTSGLHAKGIPSHAWRAISIGIAVFLSALGVAIARALW
jgi:hypothetical protein